MPVDPEEDRLVRVEEAIEKLKVRTAALARLSRRNLKKAAHIVQRVSQRRKMTPQRSRTQ